MPERPRSVIVEITVWAGVDPERVLAAIRRDSRVLSVTDIGTEVQS